MSTHKITLRLNVSFKKEVTNLKTFALFPGHLRGLTRNNCFLRLTIFPKDCKNT